MRFRQILNLLYGLLLLFLFAHPIWGQDSVQTAEQNKSQSFGLMLRMSDQDTFLPISSIEWGTPDRWSITSRYVHMFDKDRNNKTWLHNLSATLSPGTAGGRLGIGYQGIVSPRSKPGFSVLSEIRIVLLRTWGNPLSCSANRTFGGAEIRSSFSGMINLGIGYFIQISARNGHREHFFGLHVGVGI